MTNAVAFALQEARQFVAGNSARRALQAHLEWVDSSGTTKTFYFDNVISEDWKNEADITEHPVEKGPDVTDHIRDKPPEVTLVVHATNEPLGANNWMTAVVGPTAIQVDRPTWTSTKIYLYVNGARMGARSAIRFMRGFVRQGMSPQRLLANQLGRETFLTQDREGRRRMFEKKRPEPGPEGGAPK